MGGGGGNGRTYMFLVKIQTFVRRARARALCSPVGHYSDFCQAASLYYTVGYKADVYFCN